MAALPDRTPQEIRAAVGNTVAARGNIVHVSVSDSDNESEGQLVEDVSRVQGADNVYSASNEYKIGDTVLESGVRFTCITAITVPETFDPAKWDGNITLGGNNLITVGDASLSKTGSIRNITLERDETLGAFTDIGEITFKSQDGVAVLQNYGKITTKLLSSSNGAENGSLQFFVMSQGVADVPVFTLSGGVTPTLSISVQTNMFGNDLINAVLTSTVTGVSGITGLGIQGQALDMGTNLINSIVDPVAAQDAATKNYVDTSEANGMWTKSGSHISPTTLSDSVCVGTNTENSPLHVFEDTSNVGTTVGVTIQQAGTGDAIAQYLLTGGQRWVTGIDNSDGDKYKIASSLDLDSDARLTIDTSGNVGIGTTTPTEKFHQIGGNQLLEPTNPTLAGSLVDAVNLDNPFSVYVVGKYAYVTGNDSDTFNVIDITDPAAPTKIGTLTDSFNLNGPRQVFVVGNNAYVACSDSDNLVIIDISDPTTPVVVGSLVDSTVMNLALSVYVSGNHAYVTGSLSHSLAVIDISDPTNPVLVGSLIDAVNMNRANGVYVVGNYAYVIGEVSDSLAIVDISDPTNPTLSGSLLDSVNMDTPRGVYVTGKYAYVASFASDSLAIVDVSDPSTPTLASSLLDSTNLNAATGLQVSGKYAYVGGSDTVTILDVSDPTTTPVFVGKLQDTSATLGPSGIYVAGKFAYVAARNSDALAIVDISGLDVPSASIGNVEAGYLSVTNNAVIRNDLYANNLNTGIVAAESLAATETVTAATVTATNTYEFTDNSTQSLAVYPIPFEWDITNLSQNNIFDISTQGTEPEGIFFKPDGTKMYVANETVPASIDEYDLSTAWDVSTSSFLHSLTTTAQTTTFGGLFIRRDGLKLYVLSSNSDLFEYDLSTAFDVTTATIVQSFTTGIPGSSSGLYFHPSGRRYYGLGNSSDRVQEFSLGTAWDISTLNDTGNSFLVSPPFSNPSSVSFSPDGNKMFVIGIFETDIQEYDLAIPWDITTAVAGPLIEFTTTETFPIGLYMREDGLKAYIVGKTNDEVVEYDMPLTTTAKSIQVENEIVSRLTTNDKEIFTDEDWIAALNSSGELDTATYRIKSNNVSITSKVIAAAGATVTIVGDGQLVTFLNFDAAGVFSDSTAVGASGSMAIRNIFVNLNGNNNEIAEHSTGGFFLENVFFNYTGTGTKKLGTINSANFILFDGAASGGFDEGWTITTADTSAILTSQFISDGTSTTPIFDFGDITNQLVVDTATFTVTGTESVFNFDSGITDPIKILGVTQLGTGAFYAPGSLDQTTPNVDAQGNTGSPDSTTTGEFDFLNIASPQLVTITATNTAVAIAGGAWSATELERVTADVGNNGIATITALGTNEYAVNFSALIEKLLGGTTNIALTVLVNGTDTTTNPPRSVNAGIIQISGTRLFSLAENDTLQLAAFNTGNTDNIEVSQATMSITRIA